MLRPRSSRSALFPVLFVVAAGVAVLAFALGWQKEKRGDEEARRLESELDDVRQSQEARRGERARLTEMMTTHRAEASRLQRELDEVRGDLQRATKRAETAETEKKKLSTSLDLLRKATDDKLAGEAERVRQQIDELEADLANLERERAAWKAEKERLTAQVERVRNATEQEAEAALALSDELVQSVRGVLASLSDEDADADRFADRLGRMPVLLPVLERLATEPELAPRALRGLAVVRGNSVDRFLRLVGAGLPPGNEVRRAAGWTLMRLAVEPARPNHPRLDELARHDNAAVRRVVLEAMLAAKYLEDDRQVSRRLAAFLGDADSGVDTAAYTALTSRRFMPFAFEDFARRALESSDPQRARWLRSLMEFDVRAALQVLVTPALEDAWLETALLDRLEKRDGGCTPDLVAEVLPFVRRTDDDRGRRWVALVRGEDPPKGMPEDPVLLRRHLVNGATWQEPLLRALTAPHTIDPDAVRRSNDGALATDQVPMLAKYVTTKLPTLGLSVREWERSLASVCLRDDMALASVALSEMIKRPSHRMAPLLARMLDEVDLALAVDAAAVLAALGHEKGEQFLAQVIRENRRFRRPAIDKLVAVGTPQAVKAAETVFETGDPDGAWRLCEMLWPTDLVMSFECVEQLLTTDLLDPHRADIMFDYLDRVHSDTLRARTAELLLADKVVVLGATLEFIAFPPDEKIASLLRRFVGHADPRARESALRGLRFHDVSDLVGMFSRMVKDEDPLVRVQLARVLGTVDDPVARGSLIVLTKDADWLVREAAAIALRGHRGAPLIPALRACARDGQLEVKNAAIGTLVKLGRHEEIGELFLHVENPVIGKRTRRLLKTVFDQEFETSGKWSAWWETEGRFRHGSSEEKR